MDGSQEEVEGEVVGVEVEELHLKGSLETVNRVGVAVVMTSGVPLGQALFCIYWSVQYSCCRETGLGDGLHQTGCFLTTVMILPSHALEDRTMIGLGSKMSFFLGDSEKDVCDDGWGLTFASHTCDSRLLFHFRPHLREYLFQWTGLVQRFLGQTWEPHLSPNIPPRRFLPLPLGIPFRLLQNLCCDMRIYDIQYHCS